MALFYQEKHDEKGFIRLKQFFFGARKYIIAFLK